MPTPVGIQTASVTPTIQPSRRDSVWAARRSSFDFELGQPLAELRIEAPEVELVELPEIAPVGCVHAIEPVHERNSCSHESQADKLPEQLGRRQVVQWSQVLELQAGSHFATSPSLQLLLQLAI